MPSRTGQCAISGSANQSMEGTYTPPVHTQSLLLKPGKRNPNKVKYQCTTMFQNRQTVVTDKC